MIAGDRLHPRVWILRGQHGETPAAEADEPARVAEAARRMRLKHVVITAVARDDLPDGGAEHFRQTVEAVRAQNRGIAIEILVPDFNDRDTVDRRPCWRPTRRSSIITSKPCAA